MGDTVIIEDDKPAKPAVVVVEKEGGGERAQARAEKTTVTETVKVTKTETH